MLSSLNTGMTYTEVCWGDHLRIAYNADYACIYCIGIADVSELRNIASTVKPNGNIYTPCLYKSTGGKWYHGIVQYNGKFVIQYFDTYPDATGQGPMTDGSVIFTMSFKRG